jgi:hypothetical protein
VSDIDTAVVSSLEALDLNRPIREADILAALSYVRFRGQSGHQRTPINSTATIRLSKASGARQ